MNIRKLEDSGTTEDYTPIIILNDGTAISIFGIQCVTPIKRTENSNYIFSIIYDGGHVQCLFDRNKYSYLHDVERAAIKERNTIIKIWGETLYRNH